jgi:ribokinase
MLNAIEVAVFGDINVDALMPVRAYPSPGGDALSQRVITLAGGSAANTAIALARLGVATRMIGRVGDDVWAEVALRPLIEAGVDVVGVQRDTLAPTGLFFIPVTPDGERTMFGQRGANARIEPASIDTSLLDGARILHVSSYALLEAPQRDAARRAIDRAAHERIGLSLDVGVLPALTATDEIRRLLPQLSICVLGLEEALALVDARSPADAVAALVERGSRMVGLKLGAQGCLLGDASGVVHLPAFEVDVVDTTGAGDAFGAGLIFGRLRGLSLPAAGTLANALGSLAATVWGGGPALPRRDVLVSFLREQAARLGDERSRPISDVLHEIEG